MSWIHSCLLLLKFSHHLQSHHTRSPCSQGAEVNATHIYVYIYIYIKLSWALRIEIPKENLALMLLPKSSKYNQYPCNLFIIPKHRLGHFLPGHGQSIPKKSIQNILIWVKIANPEVENRKSRERGTRYIHPLSFFVSWLFKYNNTNTNSLQGKETSPFTSPSPSSSLFKPSLSLSLSLSKGVVVVEEEINKRAKGGRWVAS